MAAKFEVYIASKKYPSIKMCETIFPIVGKIQFSEKCIVWNDWLPTKEVVNEDDYLNYNIGVHQDFYEYFENVYIYPDSFELILSDWKEESSK